MSGNMPGMPSIQSILVRRMNVILTGVLFFAMTLVSWRVVDNLEQAAATNHFSARVSETILRIESRLVDYEQVLRAAAAFIKASDKVSRTEWRDYAGALQLHERYPGLQGLGYAQRLSPADLPRHVDALRSEGFNDYAVRPPGARDEYAVILYLEPMNPRTRSVLGIDMYNDPTRQEAMIHARDSGKIAITRKVILAGETGHDKPPGLLMYLPYYLPGRPLETAEERRAALTGYVYAPVRMHELVKGALAAHADELDLRILDGDSLTAEALYDSDPLDTLHAGHTPRFQRTVSVNVYGQKWTVHAASLPALEEGVDSNTPLTVLLGGLLITALATIAVLASTISRERSAALTEAKLETQRILESISDAFFALDDDWRFTYLNPRAETLLRRSSKELLGKNIWEELPETVDGEFHRQYHLARDRQQATSFIEYYEPLQIWLEVHAYPYASGISVFFRDVSQRRAREETLRLRERALEASANAIIITDHLQPDQPIIYVNPAFERITGYSAAEAIGRNCRFLQGTDRDQPELTRLRMLVQEGTEGRVVLRNYDKGGDLFWNDLFIAPVRDGNNRITHYVGIVNDITESRKYQLELERRATHDLLTGLANRGLLMDRLQLAAMQTRRRGKKIAVLFIDLDAFKMVNDGFGHSIGDQVIKLTANRLAANIRQGDTAARLGGDEFVLVLNDQDRIEDISDAVQRIMEAVLRPIPIGHHEITLTCSIGISVCPDDGSEADSLVKFADIAMYKAKEDGKNTARFYTLGMNDAIVRKVTLTNNLRRALERREFLLHYQPQVDLRTGGIPGTEALIRWLHPQMGLVSPDQFIPLAEESGQIVPIGDWIMREACAAGFELRSAGMTDLVVSVNLSPRQMHDRNMVTLIRDALDRSGLPPEALELEITETMVMKDVESAVEILNRIKQLGVRLAIDDFGTGYSSLAYLKRFPIDRLKIDKSFIRDVTTDPNDAALTRAIISLTHNLGIRVVAEGVETREQHDFLVQAGCDEAQGYLYGRPVPIAELPGLITALRNKPLR